MTAEPVRSNDTITPVRFAAPVFLLWLLLQQERVEFLSYDAAREVLAAAPEFAPDAGLPGSPAAWGAWIRERDREIRSRVDRGLEDSISNLVLFGTSFTRLPRFESAEDSAGPDGDLTDAAQARVRALVSALSGPADSERLRIVRGFLARRRVAPALLESFLAANLRRFILEAKSYAERLRAAESRGDPEALLAARGTLYASRGLSVDASLLPNYAVEHTLRALVAKSVLHAGQIRRIAVIGPGLDFADQREGHDFYPLQSLQAFAVMEGVLRLGLAKPEDLTAATFDLNPAVNAHIARLGEQARAGQPYVVQLPRATRADWRPDVLAYWERFGDTIGSALRPLAVPPGLEGLALRAVAVRPEIAARVKPFDLDIVAQTLAVRPGQGFDLIVGTNVFVYYNRLEQALALASIARMANRGAILLANSVLPARHPQALEYLGRRSVDYRASAAYGDDVVVYRRR